MSLTASGCAPPLASNRRTQSGGVKRAVAAPLAAVSRPGQALRTVRRVSARDDVHTGHGRTVVAARASETVATAPATAAKEVQCTLPFKGVVFDMDGTLTVSNIDFKTMREVTEILEGDLFTVLERWGENDPARVKRAMDAILELEEDAANTIEAMPGLLPLLFYLRDSGCRVALVTRNTPPSVEKFFELIGEEAASVFEVVLTRHFQYVKPDRRCLLHIAEELQLSPTDMLMVGDSLEDVECGNAAGTSSCLIRGGGNEPGAKNLAPPLGAIPSFSVGSLSELQGRLESDSDADVQFEDEPLEGRGAPPPGVPFIDSLIQLGAIKCASCSYPRLGGAAGGLQASTFEGHNVLHLACRGAVGFSKLLASSGLQVTASESCEASLRDAGRRGIRTLELPEQSSDTCPLLPKGCLGPEGKYDVIVIFTGEERLLMLCNEDIDEIWRVLPLGGTFAVECPAPEGREAELKASLAGRGFHIEQMERVENGEFMRLVAKKPGLH